MSHILTPNPSYFLRNINHRRHFWDLHPPLSHLRALCNHWCTYSRFGNKTHPCCFGCGSPTDQIAHTLACPKFYNVFFGILGTLCPELAFDQVALLSGDWFDHSIHRARVILLATHICFLCYHSCKHGALFCSRLVLQKLYTYTRRHHKTATFVRHFKYHERRLQTRDD